jgi:predicted RNA methylase
VTTEALIFLGELDPEAIGEAIEEATHYEPTPVAQCNALIAALPLPPGGFTFVDLGAGMGRVVLLASLHPFKQIVGVEVSPALCETARDNLVRWRRHVEPVCKDVRIVLKDALAFDFPQGDLAVYLYNPFGETRIRQIASNLAARRNYKTYVIYHTPVHRAIFDEDPRFAQVSDLGFGVIYALPSIPRSFCA